MRTVRRHGTVPVAVNDIVIVGAGLAGLACAQDLTRAGVACPALEASDGVGGRVRTDHVGGFALDLGYFEPGAMVRARGGFDTILAMLVMGAIPEQLAAALPDGTVRFGAGVTRVTDSGVVLADSEQIDAAACCWFPVPRPPIAGPVLVLDGEASGPVIAHGQPLKRPLLHPKQRVALGGERTANRSAPASPPPRPMSASEPPSSERDLVP